MGIWQGSIRKFRYYFLVSFPTNWLRYLAVLGIFFLTILYQFIPLPEERTRPIVETANREELSIDAIHPEKKYENIFQSISGDVFRLKLTARSSNKQILDVYVESPILEKLKIGEVEINSSKESEYKEWVFATPGRYNSISLNLQPSDNYWGGVNIDSLSVNRIEIEPERMSSLAPTIFEVAGTKLATLEDLGKSFLYEFMLTRGEDDFTSLYDTSASIRYDEERKTVAGAKRKGEFFTYKVDMLHPFENLMIRAEQYGSAKDQILLEYSYDNTSWTKIPYSQNRNEPQKFTLALNGDGQPGMLYVRATYDGEERQSGFFALEALKMQAIVQKQP